jgi:D-sedoheptulose 7-phosphate isomerase
MTYRKLFAAMADQISDEQILEVANILLERSRADGFIYVIGNGGSASTASHFCVDLGVGSCRRGINLRAICLTDNSGAITASGNDSSFENIYSFQLEHLATSKDILVILSASGNSPNLLSATQKAIDLGMWTVSITGFDGGELKKLAKVNLHLESAKGEYGVVEDLHLSICHRITEAIRFIGTNR